jgi:hypothetical protein
MSSKNQQYILESKNKNGGLAAPTFNLDHQ